MFGITGPWGSWSNSEGLRRGSQADASPERVDEPSEVGRSLGAVIVDGKLERVSEARRGDVSAVRWIAGRAAFAFLVLLILSVLIFVGTEVLPGDPVSRIVSPILPENIKEAVRARLGLNQPAFIRYWHWLVGALTLDFGTSVISQQPIVELVRPALLRSLVLGGLASAVIVPFSIVLGSLAAVHRGGWMDRVVSMVTLGGLSVPEFVLGNVLVWMFAIVLPVFPALYVGAPDTPFLEQMKLMVLPVLTLTPITGAYMLKTMRSSMISVLSEDFIEMASFKGLSRRRILWRHALPNALVPMVYVFALNMGYLVGGIVIVEIVFNYPGIGTLLLDGIRSQDVRVIQGAALSLGAIYVLLNLAADILVLLLDPRIRRRAMG